MRHLLLICFIAFVTSCNNQRPAFQTVTLHYSPFYLGKIYLEKMPLEGEFVSVVDSAEFNQTGEPLEFSIPSQEQALFRLRMADKPVRLYFINDADEIRIEGRSPDLNSYEIPGSVQNQSLLAFLRRQQQLAEALASAKQADSLETLKNQHAFSFADTTGSPAAFIVAYSRIDFRNNHAEQKDFIAKASKRFPEHQAVQQLVKETLAYLRIFETEYQPGEKLPPLSLPDLESRVVSVDSFRGKFIFIDLWSSWCGACLAYLPAKQALAKQYAAGRLQLVNIALDPDQQVWKDMVRRSGMPGLQLLDEKVWKGAAANTYKFDSIPFNYLISPSGEILAKAIPADSLLAVARRFIK